MKIRKYHPGDWRKVADLFHGAVHTICAADYNEAQLNAWAPDGMNLPELENRLAVNYTVVAENDGIVVGFGNTDGQGYFDCLYTHKDYQRIGVATSIADDIEKRLSDKGELVVITDASITAKPFFEKRRYIVLEKKVVECRGQYFINFTMQKALK